MPEFNPQKLASLRNTLADFQKRPLREASEALLSALGYKSDKTADFGSKPEQFIAAVEEATHSTFNRDKAHVSRWKQCAFLFQLTNDEIPSLLLPSPAGGITSDLAGVVGQPSRMASSSIRGAGGEGIARSLIESFVFLAIELQGESWSRTDLAAIARELNRRFPMPAIIIFKHGLPSPAGGGGAGGEGVSIVVIDRRANLKDAAKDVIDSRITVIKDVRIANPHRAHLDILAGLALENLGEKRRPTNFRELYDAWIVALSTQALNKRFYQELANWYFWALTQAQFPKDAPKDADGRDSLSLIRLITRIIFCWFLKEKGLLPDALFDPRKVATLLGDYNPTESTYYKAILQNLFFATLNQEMDKRVFRKAGQNFMAHNLYRYRSLMKNPDEVLKLLAGIPFMNGGLFECLDKTLGTREKPTYVRIDGFSDRDDNPLNIPNELFFGEERVVDLSGAYGDNKFKSAKATGLIHILDRYKFTVAENTPIEEEVALDPELLGKVFENLLAAYNPETGATARKQTGSFYTPREIVNYMVDESLIASLKTKLDAALVGRVSPLGRNPTSNVPEHDDVGLRDEAANPTYNTESRLRHLFAYNDQPHQFTAAEVEALIEAIDHLKILDPACGSGAFPMGVLHKLVFVLGKLDPGNRFWKARQLAKAGEIPDATVRERVMDDIEQTFGANELDYGRKLYLIENCIYGVDIQPIAVQISKLRFFISLVVEQKINLQADNRGIRPLPNLETKFVAANTLIGINRPGQQLLRNLDIDVKEAELRNVRERHFLARTPATKAKCREQDATLRTEIAELLKSDGWNTATACALAEWNPYDQNASADFFDLEWMFGMMEGFDIVIGNPPYVRIQNIDEDEAVLLKQLYFSAVGKFDIYVLFVENAFRLISKSGIACFIHPHRFLTADYGRGIKAFLDKVFGLRWAILFGVDQVFDAATTYTGIFSYSFGNTAFGFKHADTTEFYLTPFAQRTYLASASHWNLSTKNASSSDLIEKLRTQPRKISDICIGVFQGIVTVGDKIFVFKGQRSGNKFVGWSEAAGKEVELEADVMKPLLKGENIQRYEPLSSDIWIFYPHYQDQLGKTRAYSESELRTRFPKAFEYIKPFQSHLIAKKIQYKTNTDLWFSLHRSREMSLFNQPKILTPQLQNHPSFTFDEHQWYPDAGGYSLILKNATKDDYMFLLGILNSSLLWYFIQSTSNPYNNSYYYFKTKYLEPFSLPLVDKDKQSIIAKLAEKVHESKNASKLADTSALEREIDQQVYALYRLTPDEVKIVEDSAPPYKPRKHPTQEIESKP